MEAQEKRQNEESKDDSPLKRAGSTVGGVREPIMSEMLATSASEVNVARNTMKIKSSTDLDSPQESIPASS